MNKEIRKNLISAIIYTLAILFVVSALFMTTFAVVFNAKSSAAEAAEETATNLLPAEIVFSDPLLFNDDSFTAVVLNVDYSLELTEGTIYRIYVNLNGIEYVKEIKCVNSDSGDGIVLKDVLMLGNFGADACVIYNNGEDDMALFVLINKVYTAGDGGDFFTSDNKSCVAFEICGSSFQNATVHAITLASDPLLTYGDVETDEATLIGTIVDGAMQSVVSLAKMVLPTFQHAFMTPSTVDGVTTYSGLNAYGIALCSFSGLGIAVYLFKKVLLLIRNRGI